MKRSKEGISSSGKKPGKSSPEKCLVGSSRREVQGENVSPAMPKQNRYHSSARCEPLRGPLQSSILHQAVVAVFPRAEWSEEARFDLVFSAYALFHLLVQMQNIYRFNFGNWDFVVFFLGAMTLCKRTLYRLGHSVVAEFQAQHAPEDAAATPNMVASITKAVFFGGLAGAIAVLTYTLYEQQGAPELTKGTTVSSVGLTAVVIFLVPVVADAGLLMFWGSRRLEGPASPELELELANEKVVQSFELGMYTSVEAFYVAGVVPVLLVDSELYKFNTWHCQQTSLYILLSSLSMAMVHKLSSTVTDFALLESKILVSKDGVGAIPGWLSSNSDYIYIMVAMARFVVLAFLLYGFLTGLATPSIYACQLLLVVADYLSIVQGMKIWTYAQSYARAKKG